MWRRGIVAPVMLLAVLGCAGRHALPVVGAVETVRVREADLAFRARMDTGAAASVLHAVAIELAPGPADAPVAGRGIAFTVVNERGESRRLSTVVADVAGVRTAGGVEPRYRVDLRLAHAGVERRVRVSLRDRSALAEKLLVGRDFLEGAFAVDVSKGQE